MSAECSCGNYASSVGAMRELAVQQQVAVSVQRVGQQSAKKVGEALVELIDSAAQIGKEIGKGQSFDHSA